MGTDPPSLGRSSASAGFGGFENCLSPVPSPPILLRIPDPHTAFGFQGWELRL